MRIYLDNCCLGRLFDDDTQDRIRLEAEAIILIIDRVRDGEIELAGSRVLLEENSCDRDDRRRRRTGKLLSLVGIHVDLNSGDEQRAEYLQKLGLGMADSFHVVAAEKGRCDALLTTDDGLIRKAARHNKSLRVRVVNPLDWLREHGDD